MTATRQGWRHGTVAPLATVTAWIPGSRFARPRMTNRRGARPSMCDLGAGRPEFHKGPRQKQESTGIAPSASLFRSGLSRSAALARAARGSRSSDDLGRFRFVALPRLDALSGSRSGTPKGGPLRLPSKTAGLHGSIGPSVAFQDRFRQTPLDVPTRFRTAACAAIRPLSCGPQVVLSDFTPLSGREPLGA
jgi:hypothetical protein